MHSSDTNAIRLGEGGSLATSKVIYEENRGVTE